MTSINDLLSPDLLFNIFKRLDCTQTTRIRRVCKQWLEIIDEHKSFWRTLHLPQKSVNQNPSILDLFDRKSGSTLQDVDIEVGRDKEHQEQIINTLKKSSQSLKHLFLKFRNPVGTVAQDLLESFPVLNSLRVTIWYDSFTIRLRRSSNESDSHANGSNTASLLRVLWCRIGRSLLEIENTRSKNLVSLDIGRAVSSSEWRTLLEGPSRSLKHLRLGFKDRDHEDHSGILPLNLPNLEVLELFHVGKFPQWLLIPDSVKLVANSDISNLPSISELWSFASTHHRHDIANRLPKLETLCLTYVYDLRRIVEVLTERKANVEAGLQVDGVKMEMIKTLISPLSQSDPDLPDQFKQILKQCSELVDVVEGNARSRFIEVEY